MSFNVTQCPACESTFNTNSRVLAAAAGRVRCGACLNVFEAIDNFLITDEADAAQDQDESVFVGNNPQEFFDPSSFITRSALSESHDDEVTSRDPIDEQNLHQQLEQSETVSEDFFATVAEELHGRAEAPALENRTEKEEQQIDQTENLQLNIANESIDEEFEEEILDSFAIQANDAHEFTENEPADSPLEQAIEAEPPLTNTEETQFESKQPFLGAGLSASFTFDPHAHPEVRIGEPEPASSSDKETASEQPIDAGVASDAEVSEDTESLQLDTQTQALEPDVHAPYNPAMSALNNEVAAPPSSDEPTHTFAAEEASTESLPTAEPNTALQPIAEPAAHNDSPSIDSELLSDEGDAIQGLAEQEEAVHETAVEDEDEDEERVPAIEAAQTSTAEVDEESTEAIRSRALEAELSDEEALEAIPLENLAALGSMSTPVELLARKESHRLRSTLLFLSILLLGGLLSSQYLWQRKELYSQLPQLRPLYEVACTYLDCALPEYTDIDSVRSENLTVQTHPTLANGLMVNTIIRNTAAFEQPFPILILSFNSAQNNIIALREFTPGEYLDPGLRSIQAMPTNTPVQIGLAIMDPGAEAVNYTLAFRWP